MPNYRPKDSLFALALLPCLVIIGCVPLLQEHNAEVAINASDGGGEAAEVTLATGAQPAAAAPRSASVLPQVYVADYAHGPTVCAADSAGVLGACSSMAEESSPRAHDDAQRGVIAYVPDSRRGSISACAINTDGTLASCIKVRREARA